MKIVTANRLDNGAVVYLDEGESWTTSLSEAAKFADPDAKSALASAQARVTEIADVYLVDVEENGALTGRETLRESIRRKGPTVREDLNRAEA
jgi:hypothetical protein